ncbi:hypothetical protein D3C73_1380020 [compost metagenome]
MKTFASAATIEAAITDHEVTGAAEITSCRGSHTIKFDIFDDNSTAASFGKKTVFFGQGAFQRNNFTPLNK